MAVVSESPSRAVSDTRGTEENKGHSFRSVPRITGLRACDSPPATVLTASAVSIVIMDGELATAVVAILAYRATSVRTIENEAAVC